MEDALLGFQNVTSRLTVIGKTMSTLTGLLVFFSTTAYGQVILDDFFANNRSSYDFVPVFGGPSDGWTVTAGELRPSIDDSGGATWLWNKGEKLSAAGDSVSIGLSLSAGVGIGQTSIGLFLAPDAASIASGYEITLYTLGGAWNYSTAGSAASFPSAPSGFVQLTVQRTGQQTVDGFVYSTTFSGGGLASPITDSFVDPAPSLQFGPFAYNTAGTTAALDDFTFTAVPEPSMFAAVFGFLALTTAVLRTRSSRRLAA